jgi:membrane protein implicated in regulation of membrane protease activity
MEPWVILAILGALLAVAEVFTVSFFALPAGIAFLLTAATAPFFDSWPPILAILAGWLGLTYLMFATFVWPRMRPKATTGTGVEGMIGKIATVTEAITHESGVGYVQLYGDSWRAISEEAFEVGDKVKILATEGNKVIVGSLNR